ncbi:uncharacterized membrane protein YheB (UPF0754 family) [Tamaricihabitans halophyticus]|uniref:Uncharacterized membrane protein YheB (UPF0754 family) n=1 Tax=Tamaricihabitans halophyticus TaxID=1262583 RepID=A0A4R2R1W8_9PSEU|nr:DUF445 family protein [Tamaricihabitans halophyticus]TCP56692.1 uncharacterized membrane protein YheB (UPF0754 family) [Tamaricihabitans halophyticus]
MEAILADLREHWQIYASIPFIAALIGYITKTLAIEMMFRPTEFRGIKPFLGWQGVVPRHVERMATVAVDLLTQNLVKPQELFSRLDPDRVAKELHDPMLEVVEDITREVMEQYQPRTWELLPAAAQRMLLRQVQAEAPKMVRKIMDEVSTNIDNVLDVRDMVVTNLMRDKALTARLFREVGAPEFKFIARSGIYFGLIIGVVQVFAWALTKSPWVMPIFGALTGWLTDWVALKMIFYPREPKRILGLFTWQGLFQKRRREVARDYGDLIAKEVLTIRNVLEAVLTGPKSDKLFALIQRHVQRAVDEQASIAKPFVAFAVGSRRFQEMKRAAAAKVIEKVPDTMAYVEEYATDALDVRNTIVDRMQQLSPIQFEGLLRPAFKQDEWKLIMAGAVLGGLVGELQVLLLLH